jgi:hypothetical protein
MLEKASRDRFGFKLKQVGLWVGGLRDRKLKVADDAGEY